MVQFVVDYLNRYVFPKDSLAAAQYYYIHLKVVEYRTVFTIYLAYFTVGAGSEYAVLRIRDVYPGSWFLPIPDPGSRIQKQQQKRGVRKISFQTF